MNSPSAQVFDLTNRRQFLERIARSTAALAALPALVTPSAALAADAVAKPGRSASGSQRRWRTAFGLNGFQSSESVFKQTFPIWEVLEFAQEQGFEGIELIPGWLKGVYPEADDDARIASLRSFLGRYNVKAFSIQTFGAEAFQKDRSVREAWVKRFAGLAEFARKAGCECIGYWPGGDLGGQTVDEAIDSLVWSLKEMGRIMTDADLMLSVEIEPPFAFNQIEHLIRMLDGADHPRVKGMFDPSHFDLMNGSTGKPHELLKRLGVQRVGYVHFTDTDGTLFHGTSKHLPAGDGHIDVRKSLEVLWSGGYEGWIMIDPWMTPDPYDACRKGRAAIESARRDLGRSLARRKLPQRDLLPARASIALAKMNLPIALPLVALALGCAGCSSSSPSTPDVPRAVSADQSNLVTPGKPELVAAKQPTPGWIGYKIERMNGSAGRTSLPAHFQLVTATWGHENAQMPNLVYMPEKRRLLMTIEYGPPTVRTVVIYSDDLGATWSERRWLHTDAQGRPDVGVTAGLTYLGNGFLTTSPESGTRYFSRDYGMNWTETAPVPKGANGRELYHWDPLLVDRDKSGRIVRLVEARWNETGAPRDDPNSKYSQAYIWFSTDLGKSWSRETSVPAWYGVNEVALVRAKNGDIVAACRTDNPVRFQGELDLYSGMGISISRDNGATWSDLNRLYEYGRHHPSLVVLPNGDIVMPYVVRIGYPNTKDGFPRFGIEAVISHDHGRTWDLDHKYLLAYWTGKVSGRNSWWGLSQTTSTVRLPDGALLTAFGTGFRNESTQPLCKMDVGLVRWRVSDQPVNADRTLRAAPFDSELRNRCEPES